MQRLALRLSKKDNISLRQSSKIILLVLVVLILDQWFKIWVKTNMEYNQEIAIMGLSWAKLRFIENNGMAFGFSMGGDYGKLFLSVFRIIAVSGLIYFIRYLVKSKASTGMLISFALILAGAIGNIIDSAFYGMIFSASPYHGGLAEMFPEGGGYSGFLYGKVVDMLYFPIAHGRLPEWFPFWPNRQVLFLRAVFNLADVYITVGVLSTIIFHRSFFKNEIHELEESKEENEENEESSETEVNSN